MLSTDRWGITGSNEIKLNKGKPLKVEHEENILAVSIRPWTNFPREVVETPSLESFKIRPDKSLKNRGLGTTQLELEGDELDGFKRWF